MILSAGGCQKISNAAPTSGVAPSQNRNTRSAKRRRNNKKLGFEQIGEQKAIAEIQIEQLQRTSAAKDQLIADLRAEIAEWKINHSELEHQIAELGGTKEERQRELRHLRLQISQQKTESVQLAQKYAQLKFDNVSIARELAQAQQALFNSGLKRTNPYQLPSKPETTTSILPCRYVRAKIGNEEERESARARGGPTGN